jgi:hypothetical protein
VTDHQNERRFEELALQVSTDATLAIERRIERCRARVAKWNQEAAAIEPWWAGGPNYQQFCDQLARTARQNCSELEVALKLHRGS